MHRIDIKEAEGRLAELAAEAAGGGEVVITMADGSLFKLVHLVEPRPKFGSAKGLIEMSEDFDAPLSDLENLNPSKTGGIYVEETS